MATGATGTPTANYSIPKYSTSADAPNGSGFNSAMDFIDNLLKTGFVPAPAGLVAGDVPVWNGTAWVVPTGTPDGAKFLRDDGAWAAPVAPSGVPAGVISPYAGATAPADWLLCDGATVSQATYAALYAVIGHTYAADPGGGNFILPDMRGRMAVGKGTHVDVDALGENDGAAVGDRRPKHKHTVNDSGHAHNITLKDAGNSVAIVGASNNVGGATDATQSATTGVTVGPQTNVPTDGPAYVVINYIIKV